MSPRRTETLHEFGHGHHLSPVVFVGFEGSDLGGECPLVVEPGGSLNERSTNGVGARHAGCLKFAERSERFFVESY